jgi:hypothetical protein
MTTRDCGDANAMAEAAVCPCCLEECSGLELRFPCSHFVCGDCAFRILAGEGQVSETNACLCPMCRADIGIHPQNGGAWPHHNEVVEDIAAYWFPVWSHVDDENQALARSLNIERTSRDPQADCDAAKAKNAKLKLQRLRMYLRLRSVTKRLTLANIQLSSRRESTATPEAQQAADNSGCNASALSGS